jgi:hypothetical protein
MTKEREAECYRVIYKRRGWTKPHSRIFHDRGRGAERLVEKLTQDDQRGRAPVVSLRIDRRPCGEWETVDLVVSESAA